MVYAVWGKRATDPPVGRAGDGRPYNMRPRRGDRFANQTFAKKITN
ncbi:MAG: hypothetical protein FWG68_01185 [Defluviitaleaceae bacterium]|nr:hypothetical protein [Defluviitaleaceae bacterium]